MSLRVVAGGAVNRGVWLTKVEVNVQRTSKIRTQVKPKRKLLKKIREKEKDTKTRMMVIMAGLYSWRTEEQ